MYDATLGRFINRDPIAADVNLYRYCDNDPTNSVDPFGEQRVGASRSIDCSSAMTSLLDRYYRSHKPTKEGECIQVTVQEFFIWVRNQIKGDPTVNELWLARCMSVYGCVGIGSVYCQDCVGPPNFSFKQPDVPRPETFGKTTCYLDQAQAQEAAKKCGPGEHGFVWAKQGKWKNGKPTPGSDGTIASDQITSSDADHPGDFNYVSFVDGYYVGADGGSATTKNRMCTMTICPKSKGPGPLLRTGDEVATMWCATCVPCKKTKT
jgi:hypothetical protein